MALFFFFFFFTDRPTAEKTYVKNPPFKESTDCGLMYTQGALRINKQEMGTKCHNYPTINTWTIVGQIKNKQENPYIEAMGSAQTQGMFFNSGAICFNHLGNYCIFLDNLALY